MTEKVEADKDARELLKGEALQKEIDRWRSTDILSIGQDDTRRAEGGQAENHRGDGYHIGVSGDVLDSGNVWAQPPPRNRPAGKTLSPEVASADPSEPPTTSTPQRHSWQAGLPWKLLTGELDYLFVIVSYELTEPLYWTFPILSTESIYVVPQQNWAEELTYLSPEKKAKLIPAQSDIVLGNKERINLAEEVLELLGIPFPLQKKIDPQD